MSIKISYNEEKQCLTATTEDDKAQYNVYTHDDVETLYNTTGLIIDTIIGESESIKEIQDTLEDLHSALSFLGKDILARDEKQTVESGMVKSAIKAIEEATKIDAKAAMKAGRNPVEAIVRTLENAMLDDAHERLLCSLPDQMPLDTPKPEYDIMQLETMPTEEIVPTVREAVRDLSENPRALGNLQDALKSAADGANDSYNTMAYRLQNQTDNKKELADKLDTEQETIMHRLRELYKASSGVANAQQALYEKKSPQEIMDAFDEGAETEEKLEVAEEVRSIRNSLLEGKSTFALGVTPQTTRKGREPN